MAQIGKKNTAKKFKVGPKSNNPKSPESPQNINRLKPPLQTACRNIHSVYERVDSIDQGVYGSVYQGKNKETKEVVALKKVKIKSGHRNGFPLTALRETNLLLTLKHPNIVDVKEVVFDDCDKGIFLVMEYMEHDLKRVMTEFMKHPLRISEIKCFMKQLLEGIAFMHENWVLHRDLKTSNLLYDNKGRLKICDFGMARKYGDPLGNYSPNVITLWYRAPELILGAKTYGPEVDLWSAGAIMIEFLLNKVAFDGNGELDTLDRIFKILGTPNSTLWPGLKDLMGDKFKPATKHKSALKGFLNVNGRPVLSEMGMSLLRGLLNYNPKKRLTAERALKHPWFGESPPAQILKLMPTFPSRSEVKKRKKLKSIYSKTVGVVGLKK